MDCSVHLEYGSALFQGVGSLQQWGNVTKMWCLFLVDFDDGASTKTKVRDLTVGRRYDIVADESNKRISNNDVLQVTM